MLQLIFIAILLSLVTSQEPNPPQWPNSVYVFDPSTPLETQDIVDTVFSANGGHIPPFNGQWSKSRFAFLFKPGTHDVRVNVGYYTSVYGLGASPSQTTIGAVVCENGDFDYEGGALANFWRSAENFATGTTLWAVSQASPLRRVRITGDLALFQYNSGCCAGYASGGFLSDSVVTGTITSGSQQQWFTRNTQMNSWVGGVWNMVFVGNNGQPATHCGATDGLPYVSIDATPAIAEKPHIRIENGRYFLRVPKLEINKKGPTTDFNNVVEYDFTQVFVAKPGDSAQLINDKLKQGRHVVLTPGHYPLSAPITVENANAVILGIGFPTIYPTGAHPVIHVKDVHGVHVAGILFDAGKYENEQMIKWGDSSDFGSPENPGILHDVFGRVGGENNPQEFQVKTNVQLEIFHKHVILDNGWLWRADHDVSGLVYDGQNPSKHGLVVYGDHVTTYGLGVEHHLDHNTKWYGNNGRVFFYQNELPYDVDEDFATRKVAGYFVGPNVVTHNAYGVGVYSYFRDYEVYTPTGIIAPTSNPGVQFVQPFTIFLSGLGGITHILNDRGDPVNESYPVNYICP